MPDSCVIEEEIGLTDHVFETHSDSNPSNKLQDLDSPAYFIVWNYIKYSLPSVSEGSSMINLWPLDYIPVC